MASLYKRRGSRYWWIKFVRSNGRIRRESTGFRIDSVQDTRKAQAKELRKTADEVGRKDHQHSHNWADWVESYLKLRYGDSPKTHLRYGLAWRSVYRFLKFRRLNSPAMLTYQHCIDYLEWRQVPHPRLGNYAASHNTALTELKVLGVIVREAVRRGFCAANPCIQLGIKRKKSAEKLDISDAHLEIISREVEQELPWMKVSFAIGIRMGLRLNETRLWLPNVDLVGRKITIDNPKGGIEKAFTIPFDENLTPLLERLKAERGPTWAFDWPKNYPAKEWFLFFKRLSKDFGLPHYSFHCLRVTFISRGVREGVPESVMMKLVNHASTTVHRSYQRLRVEDVRPYLSRLRPKLDEDIGAATPKSSS